MTARPRVDRSRQRPQGSATASTGPFTRISGPRAYEEVVDQLTFAVRAGVFQPGDRLPSISELAQALGVSKPTIGDAIRVLSEAGVLGVQRGATGGVTVLTSNVPITLMRLARGGYDAALDELLEARRPVEMEIALLAGKRATNEDLARMSAAVEALAAARNDRDRDLWMHYDFMLHYAMGRAARSEMLAYYQHQLLERLAVTLYDYFRNREDPDAVLVAHRATYEAIASRSARRIRSAMDKHLTILERAVADGEIASPDVTSGGA